MVLWTMGGGGENEKLKTIGCATTLKGGERGGHMSLDVAPPCPPIRPQKVDAKDDSTLYTLPTFQPDYFKENC